MSTTTILIISAAIACIAGAKRPLFGAIAGAVAAPLLHVILSDFHLMTFLVLIPVGFLIGYAFAFVFSLLYSGFKGKQRTGPSFIGGGGQGGWGRSTGGIVLSDEEKEGIKPPRGKPRLKQ